MAVVKKPSRGYKGGYERCVAQRWAMNERTEEEGAKKRGRKRECATATTRFEWRRTISNGRRRKEMQRVRGK
jgi:hypothetical protein